MTGVATLARGVVTFQFSLCGANSKHSVLFVCVKLQVQMVTKHKSIEGSLVTAVESYIDGRNSSASS